MRTQESEKTGKHLSTHTEIHLERHTRLNYTHRHLNREFHSLIYTLIFMHLQSNKDTQMHK